MFIRSLIRPAGLRRFSTMAPSTTPSMAPFAKVVVDVMRKLYPESVADKSFDNTGLLLEAPANPRKQSRPMALLTVDLTKAVADEAISRGVSIIVSYHPIIFRGLKSLTLQDPQQQSLLRLAQEGISVYSPHTAVDTVPGGMADWLCDIVVGRIIPAEDMPNISGLSSSSSSYYSGIMKPRHRPNNGLAIGTFPTYTTIHPSPEPVPPGFESAGAGRLVTFDTPQALSLLIDRIGRGIGSPQALSVAIPQGRDIDEISIRTVGVCPGSGSSVLMKANPLPDLLFTGELSHHDALAAIERGSVVVTVFHSNSERGYLHDRMRDQLEVAIKEHLREIGAEGELGDFAVDVSQTDQDPYGVVMRKA